jgi:hypothetical protein
MSNLRTFTAAALLAIGTSGPAFSQRVTQTPNAGQSQAVNVGGVAGDVYYTAKPDGYHVVATLAGRGGEAPFRFEVVLVRGQAVTVSTPRALGQPADAVEITRQNDRLLVRKVAFVD